LFDRKKKAGRKPVTNTHFQNDTKSTLIQRIKRQNVTISRLESMINAPVLKIKQALDKQYKKKNLTEKGVLDLYCIVEAITFPVNLSKEQRLFCSDLVEKGHYKTLQETDEGGEIRNYYRRVDEEEEDAKECFFVTQYNVVNVFLTKREADLHLKEYKENYHESATVKTMNPLDNQEFKVIYNLMHRIGEYVDSSIYEDAEKLVNVKKKLKSMENERDSAQAELIQVSEKMKELEKENEKLLEAINIKKKKGKQ
jgi:hypothetical protein